MELDWVRNLILDLLVGALFFMLGLAVESPGVRQANEKLDQLEARQSDIVQDIEDQGEATAERHKVLAQEISAVRGAVVNIVPGTGNDEQEPKLGVVTTNLRLRVSPSTEGSVLLVIPAGLPVEIIEERDDWSRVHAFDYAAGRLREGWVASEYLRPWKAYDEE